MSDLNLLVLLKIEIIYIHPTKDGGENVIFRPELTLTD